jgi:flagellar hook-length control protein FliK
MTAVPQSTAGQAVPVTALAVEINRQAMNGKTQFDIRLDPPELGRLNVKLEVDGNGQTRTHLVVERGETLDMLTTDSRSLERALQQAGLKAEPGSVTFELAQDFNEGLAQNGSQTENSETGDNGSGASEGAPTGDEGLIPELTDMSSIEAVRQQLYLTGHLDVRV